MSMTLKSAIPKTTFLPERHSKICPKTGFAHCAALARTNSRSRKRNNRQRGRRSMQFNTLVRSEHLNHNGKLFGGYMLLWVDEYAYIAAITEYPGARFVTRA